MSGSQAKQKYSGTHEENELVIYLPDNQDNQVLVRYLGNPQVLNVQVI